MRRLAETCGVSLLLYMALFACALDRPLSLGAVRVRIEAALEAARGIDQPKLVILAGSNGPYSHRCATIGPLIGRPCINAGVAVGVGLDYLFTRWEPLLHPGDLVYLPLEEAQYSRSAAATALGPDAAIMLRHDRATLRLLPLGRQISALFASDLRAVLMSLIENTLAHEGFHDPRAAVSGESNQWGDHVGHTLALAEPNQAALAAVVPYHPTAHEIQTGQKRRYGNRRIAHRLCRLANQRGRRGGDRGGLSHKQGRLRHSTQSKPLSAFGLFRQPGSFARNSPDRPFDRGGRGAGGLRAIRTMTG